MLKFIIYAKHTNGQIVGHTPNLATGDNNVPMTKYALDCTYNPIQ